NIQTLGHIAQGIAPRLAELDLFEHAAECQREIVIPFLVDLADRLVETETGFDADDQQVKRVRQRANNALLTLANAAVNRRYRQHVAEEAQTDAEQHAVNGRGV